GPERPPLVVAFNVVLGPNREAWPFRALWIGDAFGRIVGAMAGGPGPPKEAAHGVEEIPRLRRRRLAAVPGRYNDCSGNRADPQVSGVFDSLLKVVLVIPGSGER